MELVLGENSNSTTTSKNKVFYDMKKSQEQLLKSITTKLPGWAHENEYRLIISDNYLTNLEDPKDRCFKYHFPDLDGIIFGIKTEASHGVLPI